MKIRFVALACDCVPKRSQRHYSYDESLDEPPRLIADEPVEVEREAPAEENESVEGTEGNASESPVFEE
jgi:hypothetical protein